MPVSGLSRLNQSDGIMFHGTSSGREIMARVIPTQNFRLGMQSAIAMPSGIWIVRISAENNVLLPKLAQKRPDPNISLYQSVPTQNRTSRMKISKMNS